MQISFLNRFFTILYVLQNTWFDQVLQLGIVNINLKTCYNAFKILFVFKLPGKIFAPNLTLFTLV